MKREREYEKEGWVGGLEENKESPHHLVMQSSPL